MAILAVFGFLYVRGEARGSFSLYISFQCTTGEGDVQEAGLPKDGMYMSMKESKILPN